MTGAALTPTVAAMWLFGTFFFFLILRVPVAFALGLACLPVLFIEPRLSPMVIFNTTFKAYNSFILLAVPFFLLTANLMNVGGITDRLVTLSRTMVGNFPGALAQINVLLSVFFAGISGSSTADAASQGKIFIEAQVKEGYDLSFSIAITAVSAVLAVIIPPSILMIVWGGVLSVSIGALYLAGIIPGLLIGLAQMATVHVYAKVRHYPTYRRATFKEFVTAAAVSVPALMTPFIIVGGILLGWFTATESAAAAVLYAIVLSVFFYREMDATKLWDCLLETGKLSAIALFCVGTASVFGWLLAYFQIPRALLENVTSWGLGRRRLLPGRDSRDHHRRHDAAAASGIGAHASGVLRDHRDRRARFRARHAAVWVMLDDLLCHREGPVAICAQRHDDHAGPDAGRARSPHHLARNSAAPAKMDSPGVPEIGSA
jgi:tripartite ATP-independent transporter DctM subunit